MSELFSLITDTGKVLNTKIAVICDKQSISWIDLLNGVDNLANELISKNIKSSDILLIRIDSSIEFIIALLAGIKNNLILAPLSPSLPEEEYQTALKAIKPKFLLTLEKANKGDLNTQFKITKCHEIFETNIRISEIGENGGFIRLTSGTTGKAKGVLISTKKAFERVVATKNNFKLNENDIVLNLLSLPYHFIAALLSFISSGTTLLISRNNDYKTLDPITLNKTSIIYASPYHYVALCSEKNNLTFPNLKLPISTSVGLNKNTHDLFKSAFNISIKQSYGIIEVGIPIADLDNQKNYFSNSIGKPFSNYTINILKEHDEDPYGVLAISGPGFFDAYLEPFIEASDILSNGSFITGDKVQLSENILSLIGRSTSVINIAGHKVFPEEIENVLTKLPEIHEAQVKSTPHEIFGNSLIAEIVLTSGATITTTQIKQHCKKNLDRIKVPHEFRFVKNLKKNSAGKLYRKDHTES